MATATADRARVAPTVTGRIESLDVARGVAILGILLANISTFGQPEFEEMVASFGKPLEGRDLWVETFTNVFVTGKFRSMLSILFGVGIYLQFVKRSNVPQAWPGGYLKRTLILASFGLAHGYLIWWGDILFIYSIAAFGVCLVAGLSGRVLSLVAWASAGLALLLGLLITGAVAALHFLSDGRAAAVDLGPLGITAARELEVFQQGSWLAQLELRAVFFSLMAASGPFLLPWLLPLFLLGLLLARAGAFSNDETGARSLRRCVALGFGLGLPLNMLALLGAHLGAPHVFAMAAEVIFGPVLGIGYFAATVLVAKRFATCRPVRVVARIGRTAFSNYILQSLLCTFIFYSWGLGYFGKLDRLEMLGVVLLVWGVNALASSLWLRYYAIGPLEWAWRSLTESQRLPIRRSAVLEPPARPPGVSFEV